MKMKNVLRGMLHGIAPRWGFVAIAITLSADVVCGEEPDRTARPIPATRPEMKQLLEDMKQRPPRIPLPEATAEERAALGERADDYESRLRYYYLIETEGSAFGSRPRTGAQPAMRDMRRNADENMSLTYEFKTELFWIVSRTNNCQYCLGHQEQKLSAVGVSENTIAALDADWASFPPADQAAFAWARKLTWSPNSIEDADIEKLRKYYTDLQILEMTMSVAGNNAINRWKEGTGVAQSQHGTRFFENATTKEPKENLPIDTFVTPTDAKFQKKVSVVAPLNFDSVGSKQTRLVGTPTITESRQEVESKLAMMAKRKARLPLQSGAATLAAFKRAEASSAVPAWMRLMANFPNESLRRIDSLQTPKLAVDDLSALDRARVSWVIARQDRAWYAVQHAMNELEKLGQSKEQIFALDGDWKSLSETDRAILNMARKLATSPITLLDDDVAEVVRLAGPRRATQLINFVTSRAYFDRVTEAAGLSTSDDLPAKEG